ncbi:MAG TPA: glycosyltransferase family 4 protein [Thermodesulfobacteriota bacterium]|nr:glycosyltransferase family 4 protein [Thermodesulfobacteriota bacterium]
MKILHLLSQRPDSTGSGIYLQSVMREAANRGHENFMIAGIQPGSDVEFQGISSNQCRFVNFNGCDIPFPIPGMTDIMPYPSTRFVDLSFQDLETYESVFLRILKETEADFRPDIIHSHHNWLVSSLARRLFPNIPVVTTCHGTDLRQFQNCPHLRQKVLSGCRHLDAAMVLTAEQKKYIEKNYGLPRERVTVIGAGYNDMVFIQETKPAPRPVQLVYAGKLCNAKGLPWLLKALKRIKTRDWQMHIIGGGSGREMEECKRLAARLGERVLVHGTMPQARLADIFKQAHVFVLPSLFEGLPLVVLESLACGCRVVATDLPGVMEVLGEVQAEYVTLVQTPRLKKMDQPYPEDLPSFVQNLAQSIQIQMERAVGSPQIDLSLIRNKLDTFTWQSVFDRVQEVYFNVLDKKLKKDRTV